MLVTHGRGQIALSYESGEQEPRFTWSKAAPAQGSLAPTRQSGEGMGNVEVKQHTTDTSSPVPSSSLQQDPPSTGICYFSFESSGIREFWRKGAVPSQPCKSCLGLGPAAGWGNIHSCPSHPILLLPAPHLGS